MGNKQGCPPLPKPLQGIQDTLLRAAIQRTGGFIKEQDAWPLQDGPG